MKIKYCLKLIPAVLSCLAASFSYAESFPHDRLQPWTNYDGIDPLITRYQPTYSWDNGCTSHTGVGSGIDQWNAGLAPGGEPGGACRNPLLAHTVAYIWYIPESMRPFYQNNILGIMYANYFPKDQGDRRGDPATHDGHRHDWEEVVVYVKQNYEVHRAYLSYHGDYKYVDRTISPAYFDWDRIKASYHASPSIYNNSFNKTRKSGWTVVTVQINGKASSEEARLTLERQYGCGSGAKVKDCNRTNKFNEANGTR